MKACWLLVLGWAWCCPAAMREVGESLAAAMAAAQPGDTILIAGPRVFHEHLVVTKPLLLLGTNAPVIDGDGVGTPLLLRAGGAAVRGVIVRNGGHDLGALDCGIRLEASRLAVERCRVEGGGFGIYLRGADRACIRDNVVLGDRSLPPPQRGNGIHLWKARDNIITGNVVRETRDGVYLSYADRNLLASNRIEQTRFGIHYMYSHYNRLEDNDLRANAVGAALMFARECLVAGNRAVANRRHGVLLLQVEHSRVCGNVVLGQNRGFFVQQAVQDRFEGNVIAENDIGVYLSNGSEDNRFVGNAFVHNTAQVWLPPELFDAAGLAGNTFAERGRGNYWSDYTGSDLDHDGVGDTAYHQTDLFGYLVERYPAVRLFALSPAATLLRKGEELLPLLEAPGLTDPCPLMQPPGRAAALLQRFRHEPAAGI